MLSYTEFWVAFITKDAVQRADPLSIDVPTSPKPYQEVVPRPTPTGKHIASPALQC